MMFLSVDDSIRNEVIRNNILRSPLHSNSILESICPKLRNRINGQLVKYLFPMLEVILAQNWRYTVGPSH